MHINDTALRDKCTT